MGVGIIVDNYMIENILFHKISNPCWRVLDIHIINRKSLEKAKKFENNIDVFTTGINLLSKLLLL
jgi:hypothetical protein